MAKIATFVSLLLLSCGGSTEPEPVGTDDEAVACDLDGDCSDGQACRSGHCQAASTTTHQTGILECDPLATDPKSVLEYVAQAPHDALLVVTRPEVLESYDDFRVFYGPKARVEEREVVSVVRGKDGGSTTIVFRISATTEGVASFPVIRDGEKFVPGEATIMTRTSTPEAESESSARPMTRLEETPAVVADFRFWCLD